MSRIFFEDDELYEKFKKLAVGAGIKLSSLTAVIITDWCNRHTTPDEVLQFLVDYNKSKPVTNSCTESGVGDDEN